MPKTPRKKAIAPKAKQTKLNLQIRRVLGNAYSAVLGAKFNESISSMTLESLMNEQIQQIEGKDGKTSIRLNKIDEVEKILNEATEAISTAKKLPPSSFSLRPDTEANKNANTPEVPT